MTKHAIKLTNKKVRKLQAPHEAYRDFYDKKHPNLCVRVDARGCKTFVFLAFGNAWLFLDREIELGTFPRMKTREARRLYREIYAAMDQATALAPDREQ